MRRGKGKNSSKKYSPILVFVSAFEAWTYMAMAEGSGPRLQVEMKDLQREMCEQIAPRRRNEVNQKEKKRSMKGKKVARRSRRG